MPEIQISVINKIPTIVGDIKTIVTDNSDYTIRFTFDEMWGSGEKTVYFVRSNGYAFAPVKTINDTVAVPIQQGAELLARLFVGVQQGDIKTSRPVGIMLASSITDMIDDDAVQPESGLWEDILARMEKLEKGSTGGGSAGIIVDDDGEGNVTIKNATTSELVEITDDGEGNLTIGGIS